MTPIRRQYLRVKERYPGAIVLFRLGDFYETFDEDARLVSRLLEITLTSREMGKGQRVPMAGIPYHALDNYLARLINRGHKVAICEQLTPAGKGLVERDVVRVVTPGTVIEPALLEVKSNNYLVSVVVQDDSAGLSYVDITTAEFATTQMPLTRLAMEIERLSPAEILLPGSLSSSGTLPLAGSTTIEDDWFELETASGTLKEHFGVATLEGFGCAHLPLAIRACGAIIRYLRENQKGALALLTQLRTYSTEQYMVLDAQTRRNLELFQGGRQSGPASSLLSVIDSTQTPMGGRMLKRWLGHPLLDQDRLAARQEAIDWFHQDAVCRGQVVSLLRQVGDMERLVNRIRGGHATPKELVALRRQLEVVPQIKALLEDARSLSPVAGSLHTCDDVADLIRQAIDEGAPVNLADGGVIRAGFSPELDQLRQASHDARQYLANLERREKERTGIKSLKVGYNRVFGYYIEVSQSNLAVVPADYIRKQTLRGAERFYTVDLKEHESIILNAQERTTELESAIFRQICQQVGGHAELIIETADALARLDIFAGLAEVAVRYNYRRPVLTGDDVISIQGGRHPVVERCLEEGSYIPNDTFLSNREAQIIILTGPNMSGKSTYLRHVALVVLLAQIGSFVPADSATIGLVDRIFTRIGAQDDLAAGQSTFMVEMTETANILNNATPRSLIILDEIGRGTSTYDGLSIARAVVEYLHHQSRVSAKTIFATHYHELVELAGYLPRVKNFNVAVTEEGGRVVFLHRVIPGGADRSYGIHVAQLAGLPRSVLHRAQEVLGELENGRHEKGIPGAKDRRDRHREEPVQQIPLFPQQASPVVDELTGLDLDALTPLEALNKLFELQNKARESERK